MMDDNPDRLLILGTRSFAAEVADLAGETPPLVVAGFVENMDRRRCGELLEDLPIYWVDELPRLAESHWAVCALSTTRRRAYVEQAAAMGAQFTTLIHPAARISGRSTVGTGSIVSVGAIVAARTTIGEHVILNRGALVGHHTEIGSFVTINPGAKIAGCCRIGSETYIGMGAIVLDHVSVGRRAVIGAGAVVTRDVPDCVQVLGVPARIVKRGIDGK